MEENEPLEERIMNICRWKHQEGGEGGGGRNVAWDKSKHWRNDEWSSNKEEEEEEGEEEEVDDEEEGMKIVAWVESKQRLTEVLSVFIDNIMVEEEEQVEQEGIET